jgi:hypothetical protein
MPPHARVVRVSSAAALGLAFAFAPGRATAAGITKEECIEANTKSQDLRSEGKLAEAGEQLRRCVNPACPRLVRNDCTRRLDDLEKAQPSLVFDVKDAKEGDVIDVHVSVDGQPLVDHLDGSPLKVDPGAHVFTFEVAGQPSVVDKMLIREGETGRHERVVFENLNKPPPAASAPSAGPAPASGDGSDSSSAPSPSSRGGTQRTVGLVVGGVGVAGLAAGTVFWLLGSSAWNNAKQACGGNPSACTDVASGNSYHNTATTDATVATVGFIAGGALVAAGAVLFLTGRHERSTAATVVVSPSVGPQWAGIALKGEFE